MDIELNVSAAAVRKFSRIKKTILVLSATTVKKSSATGIKRSRNITTEQMEKRVSV